jgi:protein phosphatase
MTGPASPVPPASLPLVDAAPVRLSQQTLLVLCGIPGAGKSTFAEQLLAQEELPPTSIVSSDYCRTLICDDETNQQVSADAFDLFHYIMYKRMRLGRFIIADSTALLANARHRLIEQARLRHYATCLLVFTTDVALSIQRDLARERIVGEPIIRMLQQMLDQALQEIPHESWDQVYRVESSSSPRTITLEREKLEPGASTAF